eukprot:TRINITY_DN10539_c0_g1_i1.p1 TRINITY_DN10539_c0_g1~~TRINITY_DN10539_c0_g1_i1.p1  ORF type:complete len:189 (-),score=6.85 TRINITY_DN10539_c0_g1_i1:32-598(-)
MYFNYVFILVISYCIFTISFSTKTDKTLLPDMPLDEEVLKLGTYRNYRVKGLKPNSHYEIRISYPAINPTLFSIEWIHENDNKDLDLSKTRKLLNTEKLMFQTDESGLINGNQKSWVKITAENEGLTNIPNADTRTITYNIVLESLLYGIPYPVVIMIILLLISLIFIYYFIMYYLPVLFTPKKKYNE